MGVELIIMDKELSDDLAAAGLRRYEDWLDPSRGELLRCSATSRTCRLDIAARHGSRRIYIKTYSYGLRRWRPWFWTDRAGIEARNYAVLEKRCDIRVPPVLAVGRRTQLGILRDAMLATVEIAGAGPLDEYVDRRWPAPPRGRRDPRRDVLLRETAALVARMHAGGFYHIDLQWRNLLVRERSALKPELFVIDSARGRTPRWAVLRGHGCLRDVSCLYKDARRRLTRSEQFRWLRSYLGTTRLCEQHKYLVRTLLADRESKDPFPPR